MPTYEELSENIISEMIKKKEYKELGPLEIIALVKIGVMILEFIFRNSPKGMIKIPVVRNIIIRRAVNNVFADCDEDYKKYKDEVYENIKNADL